MELGVPKSTYYRWLSRQQHKSSGFVPYRLSNPRFPSPLLGGWITKPHRNDTNVVAGRDLVVIGPGFRNR